MDAREPLIDEAAAPAAAVEAECSSYRAELPRLLRLAAPLSVQSVVSYVGQLMTVAQVGRMGSSALAAYSLASSVYNIGGLSILIGLSTALDTLCGQAYGARQYALLGLLLQRGLLIGVAACALPLLLFVFAHPVLLSIGQTEELASSAAGLLWVWAAALPLDAAQNVFARYLAAQRLVTPLALISSATSLARPAFNHVLMHGAGMGLAGAAAGHVASAALSCALFAGAVVWHSHRQPADAKPWTGWACGVAFSGLGSYLAVAAPSLALVCLSWWPLELVTVLGGLLRDPDVQVAALGVCFGTRALVYLAVSGPAAAACIRVANQLGAQHPNGAARSLAAALALGCALGVGGAALPLWLARRWWVGLFTRSARTAVVVLRCFPALLVSLAGDSVDAVLSAAARGCGRQLMAAGVTLSSYWGLGLPLAAFLGLYCGQGAPGMWLALAIATTAQGVALAVAMARLDWTREAALAERRVRRAGAAAPRPGEGRFEGLVSP